MGIPLGVISATVRILLESELGRLILTLIGIAMELIAILFSVGFVFNYFQNRHSQNITNLNSTLIGKVILYGAAVTTIVVLATVIHSYRLEIGTLIVCIISITLITAIIFALLFNALSSRLMPLWKTSLGHSVVYLFVILLVIMVTEGIDYSELSGFKIFNLLIIIIVSIFMKYIVDDKFDELKNIKESSSSNVDGCVNKSYVKLDEDEYWLFR